MKASPWWGWDWIQETPKEGGGGGGGKEGEGRGGGGGGGGDLREVLEDPVLRHTSPIWANKGSATSNLKLYDVISYETVMKHY